MKQLLMVTKANANFWIVRYIATPLTTQLMQDKEYNDYIISRTPAGRWGTPQDLRGAVVFLASPASDFVTGTSISVDGGMAGQ